MMIRFLVATLCLQLLACGTEAVTSETASGGSGGGDRDGGGDSSTGGGATGGSAPADTCPASGVCQATSCGVVWSPSPPCAFELACDLPTPCERVEFMVDETFPGEDPNAEVSLSTPAAATCVLEALRDGVEGTFEWYVTRQVTGQYATTVTVHVRPDRVALLGWYSWHDASSMRGFRGPASLNEAAHFEGCLAESEPEALLDCFSDAVADCASP